MTSASLDGLASAVYVLGCCCYFTSFYVYCLMLVRFVGVLTLLLGDALSGGQ